MLNRSIAILTLACGLALACSKPEAPATESTPAASSASPQSAAPAAAPPATAEAAPPAAAPSPSAAAPAGASRRPAGAPPAENAPPPPPPMAQSATAASSPAVSTAPPAEPPAPPRPTFREVTIPAGTTVTIRLSTPVASDTSKVEDRITGTIAKAILAEETTAVPAGSEITGSVLSAAESGRVKGRASVTLVFDRLKVGGESHRVQTAHIVREAAQNKSSDLKKGGIGAGVGAVIGGIAGGGKGAAIGAGVGGAGTVMATKGDEIRLQPGATLTTTLQEPLTVRVPIRE